MARRSKLKLAFINERSKRKATYQKRRKGLKKKVEELSTLCGVDVCGVISSEFQPEPEFWPSKPAAEVVVTRFKTLPETEQSNRMVNQLSFSEQRIAKVRERLDKQLRQNREKEMTSIMFDCLAGKIELKNFILEDLNDLGWLIDQKMFDIDRSIELLKGAGSSQVEATASGAAGGSMQPEGRNNADGIMAGGLMQPYGGTNAGGAMAEEPMQPFGATNAAGTIAGGWMEPYGWTNAGETSMAGEPFMQPYSWSPGNMVGEPTQPYNQTNAAGFMAEESSPRNLPGAVAGESILPHGWSDAARGGP